MLKSRRIKVQLFTAEFTFSINEEELIVGFFLYFNFIFDIMLMFEKEKEQ